MSAVGVVVIGRNEGSRLVMCLRALGSALQLEGPEKLAVAAVVYVDSNSTDNSVEEARNLGAEVVELDLTIPFTAARARNTGAERLLKLHPTVQYIQFVDGDTEIQPRWLAHGVDYLAHHPHVAVVSGRLRERYPEASVFNLLADMEWDTPVGPAAEFGGNALMRAEVFLHLAGFNTDFIAGEEPDLAARMRKAGHSIVRLSHDMGWHDIGMTRLRQWWKRTVRSGHAAAQLAHTHGGRPLYFYRHARRSTLLWGAAIPLIIAGLGVLASVWALLLLPAAYGYLGWRIFRHRRRRGDDRNSAVTYALFTTMGKFPQFLGLLTFYKNLWTHRPSRLIEYKTAPADGGANPAPASIGNT